MPGGKSPRHALNLSEGKHSQLPTMPYHLTLTSSSVYNSSHQRTAVFIDYNYLNTVQNWNEAKSRTITLSFSGANARFCGAIAKVFLG